MLVVECIVWSSLLHIPCIFHTSSLQTGDGCTSDPLPAANHMKGNPSHLLEPLRKINSETCLPGAVKYWYDYINSTYKQIYMVPDLYNNHVLLFVWFLLLCRFNIGSQPVLSVHPFNSNWPVKECCKLRNQTCWPPKACFQLWLLDRETVQLICAFVFAT